MILNKNSEQIEIKDYGAMPFLILCLGRYHYSKLLTILFWLTKLAQLVYFAARDNFFSNVARVQ